MRSSTLLLVLLVATAACTSSTPIPCAGCDPPNPTVDNPVIPDGGLDDAGNITPAGCHAICPGSLGCTLQTGDAGTQVTCGLTCGC
jgi:hypothetical protein